MLGIGPDSIWIQDLVVVGFLMEVHDSKKKKNVEKKIVCGWSTSKTSASKFKCVILAKASNTIK